VTKNDNDNIDEICLDAWFMITCNTICCPLKLGSIIMKLVSIYKVSLSLYLTHNSITFAAYTAIEYFPGNAIYEIDESTLKAKKLLDTEDVQAVSITNDPISGNMYVITGTEAGNQTLNRLCEGKLHPIVPISPSAVNLYCLTSGPNGVYAVESSGQSLENGTIGLGKLDVNTGKWAIITRLLAPYDGLVVAQNDKGVIHHINGNGKTFINPGSKPKMDVLRGTKFPPGFSNFCGEFTDKGNIVSTTDEIAGGISKYNLDRDKVKISQLNGSDESFLSDITIGSNSDTSATSTPNGSSGTKSIKKSSKKSKSKSSKSAKKKKNNTNIQDESDNDKKDDIKLEEIL